MSGHLIALNKLPRVRPVGVREMWCCIFAKFVLKVTVSDTTHVCRDDHLCAVLKEGIDGAVHRVQSIWEDDLTE